MMCRDKPESDDDPVDVVHDGQGGQDGGGEVSGLSGGGVEPEILEPRVKEQYKVNTRLMMVVEELEMMVEMIVSRVITDH